MGASASKVKPSSEFDFYDLGRIVKEDEQYNARIYRDTVISYFSHKHLVESLPHNSSVLIEAYWLTQSLDNNFHIHHHMRASMIRTMYEVGKHQSKEIKGFICYMLKVSGCI